MSTTIDTAGRTLPIPVDGGPGGPKVWDGCPAAESSPPAAYGPVPNSGGTCRPPTPSEPLYYQPVATDDDSLGYTAADVLNAVNNSNVGDLLWMDGTRTKLRFTAQLQAIPLPGMTIVTVYDPPPGACYRSLAFQIVATLSSDDGRLNETLYGDVTTYDEGGPFDINHVLVHLASFGDGQGEPVVAGADAGTPPPDASSVGTMGTVRSVIRPLLGLPADATVTFSTKFVLKGATCSSLCSQGEIWSNNGCFPPAGVIAVSAYEVNPPRGTCVSANIASWQWE